MADPATYGHAFWTLAEGMPPTMQDPPSESDILAFTGFISAMQLNYPCDTCRPGFEWVNQHPPDYRSRVALQAWVCEFHNAIRTSLGQPVVVSCSHGNEASKCSACSRRVTMDSFPLPEAPPAIVAADIPTVEIDPRYAKVVGDNMQEAVKVLLDMESTKWGIPVPEVIFEENVQLCPGTSCTVMDQKNPIRSTKIFLNPKQYSPRTVLHEWNHYMATVKGKEAYVQALGDGFSGDPDSEEEADRFAIKEMQLLFPNQVVAADSRAFERINTVRPSEGAKMSAVTVYKDSNVSSQLDGAYRWAEGWTHVDAHNLNLAYTPEILATAGETLIDVVFTPASSVAVNVITGVALAIIGAYSGNMLGQDDRVMLKQAEAHFVTRIVTYADPKNLAAASASARSFGAMVGRGQVLPALQASVNPAGPVITGFRSLLSGVQGFGGRTRQIPQTNEQHSTTSVSGTSGAPTFQ